MNGPDPQLGGKAWVSPAPRRSGNTGNARLMSWVKGEKAREYHLHSATWSALAGESQNEMAPTSSCGPISDSAPRQELKCPFVGA